MLGKLGIRPHRSLEDDLKLQTTAMSYGGTTTAVTVPERPRPAAPAPAPPPARTPAGARSAPRPPRRRPVVATTVHPPRAPTAQAEHNGFPTRADGLPDFSRMDAAQRLAYHRQRLGLGR